MVTVLLGLAVAASYGSADFLGGLASKRTATATVTVIAQATGLVLLVGLVVIVRGEITLADVARGALAGSVGVIGLSLLYRGLAEGRMSVVAPITAVGAAVVPLVYGVVTGERPSATALVGAGLALVAVVLISRTPSSTDGDNRPTMVAAAVGAGAAFGIVFVLLGETSTSTGMWPLVAARAAGVVVLVVSGAGRLSRPTNQALPVIVATGVLDVTANALYVVAARRGLISLVAVLSSLYPAATVVLARLVLDERLTRHQLVGLLAAGAGVTLIAAG